MGDVKFIFFFFLGEGERALSCKTMILTVPVRTLNCPGPWKPVWSHSSLQSSWISGSPSGWVKSEGLLQENPAALEPTNSLPPPKWTLGPWIWLELDQVFSHPSLILSTNERFQVTQPALVAHLWAYIRPPWRECAGQLCILCLGRASPCVPVFTIKHLTLGERNWCLWVLPLPGSWGLNLTLSLVRLHLTFSAWPSDLSSLRERGPTRNPIPFAPQKVSGSLLPLPLRAPGPACLSLFSASCSTSCSLSSFSSGVHVGAFGKAFSLYRGAQTRGSSKSFPPIFQIKIPATREV